MTWCENNGIDYLFGLSGTKPLSRKVEEVADNIRTRRAIENLRVLRGYAETRHKAKSWDRERRAVAFGHGADDVGAGDADRHGGDGDGGRQRERGGGEQLDANNGSALAGGSRAGLLLNAGR